MVIEGEGVLVLVVQEYGVRCVRVSGVKALEVCAAWNSYQESGKPRTIMGYDARRIELVMWEPPADISQPS